MLHSCLVACYHAHWEGPQGLMELLQKVVRLRGKGDSQRGSIFPEYLGTLPSPMVDLPLLRALISKLFHYLPHIRST